MADILIYGKLKNQTTDNIIAGANQLYDDNLQKFQSEINQNLQDNIQSSQTTIGNYTVNGHKISENPVLTKTDIELGNVTNEAQIPLSQKGANSGVATLDESGKVPSTQLPSFVDDVLEYENFEAFPETGESGKIYVTKDTNLEYRWSGTQYTQISKSLALGETSQTAYAGDKGKQVTDKVAEVYSANSVVSGLSDITFSSDTGSALSADEAIKTWDGSNTTHDLIIPYATSSKAGVMSAADKTKLDSIINIGDGNQFLGNDLDYHAIDATTVKLSDSYLPSTLENNQLEPSANDTTEIAVGKLHKAILDNEEVVIRGLQNIYDAVGLEETNQQLPDLSNSNYMKLDTNIVSCLLSLDAKIKELNDALTLNEIDN